MRPVQVKYQIYSLGPKERTIDGQKILRKDINILNRNDKNLSGFIFTGTVKANHTVLYLHGNGGSKLEALPLV